MKSLTHQPTRQEWYGALVVVLVLGVLLSIAPPYFFTAGNLSNILVRALVIALLAAAFGIGAAVGIFNGYLVAFVGISSFILTLGGLTLWRGMAFDSTGGFDNSGIPDPLPFIGYGQLLGVYIVSGLCCALGAVLITVIRRQHLLKK